MKIVYYMVLGGAVLSVACASTPVPADKLARSSASIRSAETVNAGQNPTSSTHLALARQEMAEAKANLKEGNNEKAGWLLLRAEADADAAMNLAREAQARAEAQQTMQSVQNLKAQLEVPQS
jgi:hypothetical protein